MTERANDLDRLARDVRIHVFREAAATGRVPQAPDISRALGRPEPDVRAALRELATAKVLILAPNDGDIWAANPFCAVPSGFRVAAAGRQYWGICIWDALGIAAAVAADAVIRTVRRLWRRHDARSAEPTARPLRARRPLRHTGASVVGQHRLYLKHDAALP